MTALNRYERDGRERKVTRFVLAFDETARAAGQDPTDPTTAKEIVRQLNDAPEEKWAALAEDLKEPKTPSPSTRAAIIAHYQHIANRLHVVPDTADRDRPQFARAAGDAQVRAVCDGSGFAWSLYVRGQFVCSGYVRDLDVEKAFAEAIKYGQDGSR